MKLAGQIALVTGGSRGIGRATALAFAAEGADIAFCHLDDGPKADETASEIRALGRRAMHRSLDVVDIAAGRAFAQEAAAAFGPIDILFNNAGMNIRKRFEDYTEADYDRVLDVHMKGMFFMAQAVYPAMVARGRGCIVNVASQRGLKGAVNSAPYCAAKAAIIGFTRALACEAAPKGVRVNAIAPGPIVTDLTATMAPEDRQAFIDALPVHRFGRPEEIAATALLLAGPDGAFYVGATLSPNGGDVMYLRRIDMSGNAVFQFLDLDQAFPRAWVDAEGCRVFQFDAFLSHNRDDGSERLLSALSDRGVVAWHDGNADLRDRKVLNAVGRAIDASRTIVLCAGAAFRDSHWVQAEYLPALKVEENGHLTRVVIAELEPGGGALPGPLRHCPRFACSQTDQLAEFLIGQNRLPSEPGEAATSPASRPRNYQELRSSAGPLPPDYIPPADSTTSVLLKVLHESFDEIATHAAGDEFVLLAYGSDELGHEGLVECTALRQRGWRVVARTRPACGGECVAGQPGRRREPPDRLRPGVATSRQSGRCAGRPAQGARFLGAGRSRRMARGERRPYHPG